MVGKRAWEATREGGRATGNGYTNGTYARRPSSEDDFDAEDDTTRPKPRLLRFKDVASSLIEDQRRQEIKKLLVEGIVAEDWNKYRKSKEDIKAIRNKKIRQFYQDQNVRLNDWLEVDSLVETLAGGIFDSFNPDRDRDGIAERVGALQDINENIEALLPTEEREARTKAARNAKWAINVMSFS